MLFWIDILGILVVTKNLWVWNNKISYLKMSELKIKILFEGAFKNFSQVLYIWRFGHAMPVCMCIFKDWPISLYIVATSKSNKGLVFRHCKFLVGEPELNIWLCVVSVCVCGVPWMDAMLRSGREERQMYSHNQCVQYMWAHICGCNKDMNRAGILAWASALHGQSKLLSQVFQVGFWCCKKQISSTHWVDWGKNLRNEDDLKNEGDQ